MSKCIICNHDMHVFPASKSGCQEEGCNCPNIKYKGNIALNNKSGATDW